MPAPNPTDPEALYLTCAHYQTYAGAVADTNLVAEGLAPSRRIRCEVAGKLNVKRASDKATITLNFKAGESQEVAATDLVAAGSTATDVTVYF